MGIILRLATLAIVGYTFGSFAQSVRSTCNMHRLRKSADDVLYVELTTQDGTTIALNQQQWKEFLDDRSFATTYAVFTDKVKNIVVRPQDQPIQ